jgi:hypothetical protein
MKRSFLSSMTSWQVTIAQEHPSFCRYDVHTSCSLRWSFTVVTSARALESTVQYTGVFLIRLGCFSHHFIDQISCFPSKHNLRFFKESLTTTTTISSQHFLETFQLTSTSGSQRARKILLLVITKYAVSQRRGDARLFWA